MLEPDHGSPDRPPQERPILGDQQETDRQQLDPDYRQKPEQATDDEEHPDRDADPACFRVAQLVDDVRHTFRHPPPGADIGTTEDGAIIRWGEQREQHRTFQIV